MQFLNLTTRLSLPVVIFLITSCHQGEEQQIKVEDRDAFVVVSSINPAYFELSNGSVYIPNGFNLVPPPNVEEIPEIINKMAENRINYCRVWLAHGLWDIEHEESGVYDEERVKIIDKFLALCHENGIRVKMCIEYFRNCPQEKTIWHDKVLHHVANGGPFNSMEEYLNSARGREQFIKKLEFYQSRYGDHPAVFAWELWNEVNCVKGDYMTWTKAMLPELHRLFPKNLAVQSLGSYDYEGYREEMYRPMTLLQTNDVAQVHRYLDLGARWEVCHAPADVLAAEAVRELLRFDSGKPVLLAETGAVKPRHTGYSEIYDLDTLGVLNHDQIFAPFFAGAAGTGNAWWWRQSIDRFDQWYLYDRFAESVKGIDPVTEQFKPVMIPNENLRIYALDGVNTLIAWCKDIHNDWRTEFEMGMKPELLEKMEIDLEDITGEHKIKEVRVYDPWEDRWTSEMPESKIITLPPFKRSIVFKVIYDM